MKITFHPFSAPSRTLFLAIFVAAVLCLTPSFRAADLPEPGPESGGMRLRFVVVPERKGTNETYQVRVDVINVTDRFIKLIGDWPGDYYKGDYKEYLESDVSIQTEPPIMRWVGQWSSFGPKTNPQPEYTLGPKEVLTLQWVSSGRGLKNKLIHVFSTHGPRFPSEGLYSVRASVLLRLAGSEAEEKLAAIDAKHAQFLASRKATGLPDDRLWQGSTDDNPHGSILLTSNEQLVPVGGSRELPKHSLAKLLFADMADTNRLVAGIDLGAAHKIEVGDQFQILTRSIGNFWHLKITYVDRTRSYGVLEPSSRGGYPVDAGVLVRGALAELIPKDDSRHW